MLCRTIGKGKPLLGDGRIMRNILIWTQSIFPIYEEVCISNSYLTKSVLLFFGCGADILFQDFI